MDSVRKTGLGVVVVVGMLIWFGIGGLVISQLTGLGLFAAVALFFGGTALLGMVVSQISRG